MLAAPRAVYVWKRRSRPFHTIVVSFGPSLAVRPQTFAPYDNQPGSETPLYEHLQRSLRYTLDRLGPHGLPLIGRADWNDCLNLNCFSDTPGQSFQTTTNKDGTVAESVFIAGMFVLAAQELAAIAERRGLAGEARGYLDEAETMEATVHQHGWDGEWFVRAYDAARRRFLML